MVKFEKRIYRLNHNFHVQKLAVSLLLAAKWRLLSDDHSFLHPGKDANEKKPSATFAPWPFDQNFPSFIVWSSNPKIHPFKSKTRYSPVEIVALLSYDGDLNCCLESLAAQFLSNEGNLAA